MTSIKLYLIVSIKFTKLVFNLNAKHGNLPPQHANKFAKNNLKDRSQN